MPTKRPLLLFSLIAACALRVALAADAPVVAAVSAIDSRWEASLAAFSKADQEHLPQAGGVLFVGSSSIRLWDKLETRFDAAPVVLKRGFGGSSMADCTTYLSRLVLPYKPRLVLVYAGDNDLAEGRTPQQVLESFAKFVEGVHAQLPGTRIAYISIKPSPARALLLAQVRDTNARIKAYTAGARNTEYIDIFTPMLDAGGVVRAELFRDDALHLNDAGYALWTSVISAYIK